MSESVPSGVYVYQPHPVWRTDGLPDGLTREEAQSLAAAANRILAGTAAVVVNDDTGAGVLEVGTTAEHLVVVNLPRDMTGHIVFSPLEARMLADTLVRKARDAEHARRERSEADRVAQIPPADRTRLCTTSGEPVDKVRAEQTNETGQHKSYIVLCDEERAKGFIRPYRDTYTHVGPLERDNAASDAGLNEVYHRVGGCKIHTTMGRELSETYARDPSFYSHTFCLACNKHLPVGEFVWTGDGQQVGS